MFDWLYFHATHFKKHPLDSHYEPKQAITKRYFVSHPSNQKLAVIFPNWHPSGKIYKVLRKRLHRRGWTVLYYEFHSQILMANEQLVIRSMQHIQKTVAAELCELSDKNRYRNIHLIGLSLGNVPLTMVSDNFSDFSGATLVVPGDDLAVDTWHSNVTQDIRKSFEDNHVGITKLDTDWKNEAPRDYVRNFTNKPVTIFMSLNDKVIRTRYQRKMVELITKSRARVDLKTSRLGHVLTIVRFCLAGPLP
ncbi:hypothetical protein HYW35_02435 [Candidatus Saccharibacteria bacterium]|nr:hypothetical protein [Candidatus Saccharibacteria bacterium]